MHASSRLAGLGIALYLLLACTLAAAASNTASTREASPVNARRSELKDLRGQINKLDGELAKTRATHSQTRGQLHQTETAIAATNRTLQVLGSRRNDTEAALNTLSHQSQRLESRITSQQQQLSRLLWRQYTNTKGGSSGEHDALRLLLSGNDAHQVARDLHYLTHLSRAKADLLNELQQSLDEKRHLSETARERREELATIEQQQQQQRSLLLDQQRQRQSTLASLGDKLKAQQREIGTLRRDEQRLTGVIEQLIQTAAREARARAAARKKAQSALAQKRTSHPSSRPSSRSGQPPEPAPGAGDTPQRNDHEPEDTGYHGNFNALKGQLRLPVRGELTHRFGSPRAESGGTWKGLFIRASEGSEVKAPAPGRVVYADWLRGFGNLLIVDHGDTWLSVYGNNQSLLRRAGDSVKTGDTLATVGSSGSVTESGLYFELRQQGRAIDPMTWVNLR